MSVLQRSDPDFLKLYFTDQKIYDIDGPFVTQTITPIHPFPLFFTKLFSAGSHFCHLTQALSPLLYFVLYYYYYEF